MKVIFRRNAKTAEIPVFGPCTLKIYEVPASYSEDRLFASVQNPGELEPVPACGHSEALLLVHAELAPDENGTLILTTYQATGEVRYAQD